MKQSIRFTRSRDGTMIAYAKSGSGPPLVRAANWLTHLEFDWESPVWRHWLRELSRRHTLIRYDERGCGLSDREVDDLSFESWVADLEAVVDAAGLERFPLFGMSQGGPVGIAYAARHPERVSHLILYGSYAVGWRHRTGPDYSPGFRRLEEALLQLMADGWGRDNPAFRQVFTSIFIPDGSVEQERWFNDLQRETTSPHIAVRLEKEFGDIDVRDLLEDVRCPVLVLHARDDQVIPFQAGRQLAAGIPDARFVALDGQNHVLLEDEPAWDRFLEETYAFLDVRGEDGAPDAPYLDRLTDRERQVLDLVAAGRSNPAIADELSIETKTVKNHVSRIYRKMDASSRAEAIVAAREAGLGRGSPPAGS